MVSGRQKISLRRLRAGGILPMSGLQPGSVKIRNSGGGGPQKPLLTRPIPISLFQEGDDEKIR
jgi:hypothetical protein